MKKNKESELVNKANKPKKSVTYAKIESPVRNPVTPGSSTSSGLNVASYPTPSVNMTPYESLMEDLEEKRAQALVESVVALTLNATIRYPTKIKRRPPLPIGPHSFRRDPRPETLADRIVRSEWKGGPSKVGLIAYDLLDFISENLVPVYGHQRPIGRVRETTRKRIEEMRKPPAPEVNAEVMQDDVKAGATTEPNSSLQNPAKLAWTHDEEEDAEKKPGKKSK